MKYPWLIILLVVASIGCTQAADPLIYELNLTAQDYVRTPASYYDGGSSAVILLHNIDESRQNWGMFPETLQKEGYSVIVIEFRKSPDDYNKLALDADAAHQYLQNMNKTRIIIIGSGIGANTALNYAASANISEIVLISPAFEYNGVSIDESLPSYRGRLLAVASTEDTKSYYTIKAISSAQKPEWETALYNTNANLLYSTALQPRIIEWLG